MKLGTILKIVGVLFVGVIVAVVAVLMTLDLNDYKPEIIAETKKATGRDLIIDGDLQLEISLTPAIAVNGVRFANAAWGSKPDMVKVDRFEARVALIPLLTSTIDVEKIVLIGAEILLEKNAKGEANFIFAGEEKPATSETPAAADGKTQIPVVRHVTVENANISYKDAASGQSVALVVKSLSIKGDGLDSPLAIDFDGSYNDNLIRLAGTLGAPATMLGGGKPFPLDLTVDAGGAKIALKGAIADLQAQSGIDIALTAEGENLSTLSPLAGTEIPSIGPYSVAGRVSGDVDKAIKLSGLAAKLGGGDGTGMVAEVSGAIADVKAVRGLDIHLKVVGDDLSKLSTLAKTPLPPLGPYTVAAKITGALDKSVSLSNLAVKMGGSDLSGTVTAALGGAVPVVDAVLSSKRIDIADFVKPGEPKDGAKSDESAKATADDSRVFPDDPLPLDGLKAANATAKISIETLIAAVEASNVQLGLSLQGGDLKVAPLKAVVAEGTLDGSLRLDGGRSTPVLDTDLKILKFNLGKFLGDMAITDLLEGTINVNVDLRGQGGSVRQLMAGLNGKTQVAMGAGRMKSTALDTFIGGPTKFLTEMVAGKQSEYTVINCIVSQFDIKNGLATSKALVFDTDISNIAGKGTVNLATEALNLDIDPRPKSATLNTAVAIEIRGTLANPEYGVNKLAAARKIGGILGSVAFPPALIVGLAETGTGETASCGGGGKKAAPAKQQAAPKPSLPLPKSDSAPVQDSLKKLEKGVGGALKGLFGN